MDRESAEPHIETFPGPVAEAWVNYQMEVAAKSTQLYDFVWDISAEAIGPFCQDPDGNTFLDFTSHVASAPLGYNHPRLLNELSAAELVDPLKIAGQDFYVGINKRPTEGEFRGPAALMHALVEITEGFEMDTVFLSNSGAEAVENAIKSCYDHRNGARYGVAFDGAFHGRTLGALSLNRSKAIHRRDFPEIGGITVVPYCDDETCTPTTCSCGFFPDGNRSRLRALVDRERGVIEPDDIAYIIVEPIQGEGGYRVPSDAFVAELDSICSEFGIPLIADEIQTGVGRTGEWWASSHFGITPDVITSAKALRVGATISSQEIFPAQKSRLSSTWGAGDILSSIIGTVTIDIIRQEGLLANAKRRGQQLMDRLIDAKPRFTVDIRGKGLMVGIEFDSKARRDAVMECCLKRRGLLTLPCGYKTLRLLPPLDVTEREIMLGVDLILDSIGDHEVQKSDPQVETGDDVI